MINIRSLGKMFLSATALSTSLLSYSNSLEPQVTNRYIIKFAHDNNSFSKEFIGNKLFGLTGKKVTESEPLANNLYLLKTDVDNEFTDKDIQLLNADSEIKYITKDRVGYFKPVPDPVFVPELTQKLIAKLQDKNIYTDETPVESKLNHSMQWDEFKGPEGVFLESKPNMSDGAWSVTTGYTYNNNPVTVAVLDTGIEYNNSLANNIVKKPETNEFFGWNFSHNDADLSDQTGGFHGTHVAGTIAGHGPNVLGMGPALNILPVKICDETGMFYESNVIRGIYWAIGATVSNTPFNHSPAKVINMSFGIDEYVGKEVDTCSPAVQEAIDYARDKGVIMVVAAGNSNLEHDLGSPGGCKGTLRIASTGPTGLRSYFSNYGEGISFAAPGGDKKYGQIGGILSTVKAGEGVDGSDYDFYQGTSMAAPHVAGLAGLIYSLNDFTKNFTAHDVEKILYTTTHDFENSADPDSSCVGVKSCGHGIIDAKNAVEAASLLYDVIFSSPKAELLGLEMDEQCRDGYVSPKNNEIITAEGNWILDNATKICQKAGEFSHPQLKVDSVTGSISAKYGHVVYNLETTNLVCSSIGYDGAGCYNISTK